MGQRSLGLFRLLKLLLILIAVMVIVLFVTYYFWLRYTPLLTFYKIVTNSNGKTADNSVKPSVESDIKHERVDQIRRVARPLFASVLEETRLKILQKKKAILLQHKNETASYQELYTTASVMKTWPVTSFPNPKAHFIPLTSPTPSTARDFVEVKAPDAVQTWRSGSEFTAGLSALELPQVNVTSTDCTALFRGDAQEHAKAKKFQMANLKTPRQDEEYIKLANNCTHFIRNRRYATLPANLEEAEYPIAFSILMFKHVEQFERLLRAVYRPQNLYCIHVDAKSPESLQNAVRTIVHCFENVFVLYPSFSVSWGAFTVLQPEIKCMEELLRRSKKWKYFINLTGQEFPLKTNWQIVRILKAFNSSNNLEGTVLRRNIERFSNKPPPPFNITLTKGSVHIVAVRGFVDFVVNDDRAKQFLEWVKDTFIPDETFFTSLNHNPHLKVPGAYLGVPETDADNYRFMTRFKNWGDGPFNWPCYGRRVSMVCVFAVGDLPLLGSRPELFANKFYLDFEPLALDCIEELHYSRLTEELLQGSDARFDTSMYSRLPFVRNHV